MSPVDTLGLLSAEARFLLATAARDPGREELTWLVEPGFDWPELFRLARRERAWPALWSALARLGPEGVPHEAWAAFQQRSMVSEFRMQALEAHLRGSVEVLANEGIPVLLLKGAALGMTVYTSLTERPMLDLDLLVRPSDASRAWELLERGGWEGAQRGVQDSFYEGHHHLRPLRRQDGTETYLELHTEVLPRGHPFSLLAEDFWAQASEVTVGLGRVWVPCPEHLVIHACIHLAWSHGLSSRGWGTFRDLGFLLTRSGRPLEWGRVVGLAREARAGSSCYWALRLGRALVGLEVPQSLLETMAPAGPAWVRAALERQFALSLFPVGSPSCPSVSLTRMLWSSGIQPGRSGHGRIRPWGLSETFLEASEADRGGRGQPATTSEGSLRQRLLCQVVRPAAWGRYVRALLRARR